MGTIFVAGVYGVGKSTLCASLSDSLGVPAFSAGELISLVNGEDYKRSKAVKDAGYNQEVLAIEVDQKLKQYPTILLAGHFCIFDEQGHANALPCEIFGKVAYKTDIAPGSRYKEDNGKFGIKRSQILRPRTNFKPTKSRTCCCEANRVWYRVSV